MIGTSTFILRSLSLMCGTAAAASSRSTVMRTSSEPARASAATCRAVASASAVSVLVMDWTTIGASPPTDTPATSTATERRRGAGAPLLDILRSPLTLGVPERRPCVNVARIFIVKGGGTSDSAHRSPATRYYLSRPAGVRFTRTRPITTIATAAAKAGVSGSPRTKCPAATPNSGVRKVNADRRLAE